MQHFLSSIQMSMKFILLVNIKMPNIVDMLIFTIRINFMLSPVQQEIKVTIVGIFLYFVVK